MHYSTVIVVVVVVIVAVDITPAPSYEPLGGNMSADKLGVDLFHCGRKDDRSRTQDNGYVGELFSFCRSCDLVFLSQ